ncbi:hypothetical protein F4808DRAFT_65576 [Astrocystis sublimbata]|nr:hypothetical protein F4808DRAFT_65576 [Astrocystis sublimbata]
MPQPIIIPHTRQVVSTNLVPPKFLRLSDRDSVASCVCINCHINCRNDATLRKHGADEGHTPYGCVCGSTFCRLDALERHINSKNKVIKVQCSLCQEGEASRAFHRLDHLSQHLRNFHRIAEGKIPDEFAVSSEQDSAAENGLPRTQLLPSFPCPVLGCDKIGEQAYCRQQDLDEHIFFVHSPPAGDASQHGPYNTLPDWTNSFHQNTDLGPSMMFGQNMLHNYLFPGGMTAHYQIEGGYAGGEMSYGYQNLQQELPRNFESNGAIFENDIFAYNQHEYPDDEPELNIPMDIAFDV